MSHRRMDTEYTHVNYQHPAAESDLRVHGLVSVIIPTYNYARYLVCSVGSVLKQSHWKVEVIVVDDGSTDAPELHLGERISDTRVKVVRQAHAGISAARNRGIVQARGQYVTFLDADDMWPSPNQLARQVEYMEANPEVGLLFGDAQPFGPDGRFGEPYLQAFGFYPAGVEPTPCRIGISAKLLCTKGFFIPTGALLIRGTCLNQVGMFDANLRMFEDVDLWLRICRAFPVTFSPEVFLLRREHGANVGAARPLCYQDFHHFFNRNDLAADGLSFRSMSRELYFELGRHHLGANESAAAIKAFARTLLYGFYPKSLIYIVLALLGKCSYVFVQRIRDQVKRLSRLYTSRIGSVLSYVTGLMMI